MAPQPSKKQLRVAIGIANAALVEQRACFTAAVANVSNTVLGILRLENDDVSAETPALTMAKY